MPVAQPKAMTFVCPCCKETVRVPESYAGRAGRCPRCKGAIRLPEAGANKKPGKPRPQEKAAPTSAKRAVGGTTRCTGCRASIPDMARTCPECGEKLDHRRLGAVDEDASVESQMFSSGMVGGVAVMLVAVGWFCLGWSAGRIYLYPPIMFFCGLGAVIKALGERPLPRRGAATA